MRRADVYLIEFEPVRGSEANKVRPAVIVSNDGANNTAHAAGRGVLTVVPVTSNTDRVYPFQVRLVAGPGTGLTQDSKAQAEQVRAVDVSRLRRRLGSLHPETMRQLDAALRLHLRL